MPRRASFPLLLALLAPCLPAADELVLDAPQCAGMSGFRAQWDLPLAVAENGERVLKDNVIKDRGQSAVWGGAKPGPLAFDAVHRSLLVRFPDAAEKIATALGTGKAIAKVELVLPYLDEELWPTGSGGADYPTGDGYRYRTNWDCDKLYRASRPNWHALAWALRKPWRADAASGPTYNAAVNGAVYWKRFGAGDPAEDRFPKPFGPTEVSSYHPDGRMDVTALLSDPAYGAGLGERLRTLADCGFLLAKEEVYDARYFQGAYEWAISTGPRAILVRTPKLVVTFTAGKAGKPALAPPADPAALARAGAPTAVLLPPAELAKLDARFLAKPDWMPDWQYQHVRQLLGLESGGKVQPFYYRLVPPHVINRAKEVGEREAKQRNQPFDADYAVYLAWVDWVLGTPPRWWDGHLTAANNVTQWYNYRDAMPGPVREAVLRSWNAWLMPERATELDGGLRRQCDNFSGRLVHPMVDDPRVGRFADGKQAEWNQGDTYYKKTGDWRGNKSYYRSGFTREMSTANFNSSASSGALLNGQIVGSQQAMADGRAGLMQFPFWMWTYSGGVGQEYVDHYYWAIATASNKNFADFCQEPEDRAAGRSLMFKTVNDLAGAYHPRLKKLLGPASRTYYEHVLGQQDGLYHILHVLSEQGALNDTDTGTLPAITQAKDENGNAPRPVSAWGHDYPPETVGMQSLSGPWAEPWLLAMIDRKPLPWAQLVEKEGDPVTTWFGENYGLTCIRSKPQRLHMLGHWRRSAQAPTSMRDLGTIELRLGFNQTTIGCDGEGVVSQQGLYRCYQREGTLLMLARPQPQVIAQQAGEHQFGNRKLPAQEIRSVQCSAALFSFQAPQPGWEIRIDGKPVAGLPATAKQGQVITIRDGVSHLALRPLPTDDLGRDADITLEAGQPQTQAYHWATNIQPALLVHANFYRRDAPLGAEGLKKLAGTASGFVLEMGDEKDAGGFAAFERRVLAGKLSVEQGRVRYEAGKGVFNAAWDAFTVDGADPAARLTERSLLQDTPVSQFGRARLEKGGAVVERGSRHPELAMFLHAFPAEQVFVATNPLPNYLDFSLTVPGGMSIRADGGCSMGSWVVREGRRVEITHQPFGEPYRPRPEAAAATMLFIAAASKPAVTLNGAEAGARLKAWKLDGADGWLLPLASALPDDAAIAARWRVAAAQKLAAGSYLQRWWIASAFPAPRDPAQALDQAFPPEQGAIDTAATYPGGVDGRPVAWRRLEAKEAFGAAAVLPLGQGDDRVAYAYATVVSDADREVTVLAGSDDGLMAWVNGERVWRNPVGRPCSPDEDSFPAKLRKGENAILLKICQGNGGWGFCLRLTERDGTPLRAGAIGIR